MKINIKKTSDLITPALEIYIQEKLMPIAKFVKHADDAGEAEIWLEISRTTNHHRKGEVFMAAADLRLSHKVLRGESIAEDIRTAIDKVRDTLRLEIDKYKTQFTEHRRGGKSDK
jgi:ribosomal subunit interface protein